MDRSDEKRDSRMADEVCREGDVLGLGGSTVPKMPGDPTASNDPSAVRHRRERALDADNDTGIRPEDPFKQSSGAAGIDMGAGGRGTDVSGE
jgi:hypothetical protein